MPKPINRDERNEQIWRIIVLAFVLAVLIGVSISYVHRVQGGQGAFNRWRPTVEKLVHGENIYAAEHVRDGEPPFPTTPIVALALFPLLEMPPLPGAIVFAIIKIIMAALAVRWAILLAIGSPARAPPAWAIALVVVLTARPIISDIQHGNINLLVLFLVMAGLWLFARERPMWGGILIGIATVVKVTPGLLILYFLWKREWRVVMGCVIGMAAAVALPAVILGSRANYDMHFSWFEAMILPFVSSGGTHYTVHINQSLPGLFLRLTTESQGVKVGDGDEMIPINFLSLDVSTALTMVKVMLLGVVAWLAFVCRTRGPRRDDWRLACEWGLILIGMLIISERTWKHHYVTIVLPVACVVMHLAMRAPPCALRRYLIVTLVGFFALTVLTSGELIGWIYEGVAHKFVEGMGSFFVAGVLLFAALSTLVLRSRTMPPARDVERSPAADR